MRVNTQFFTIVSFTGLLAIVLSGCSSITPSADESLKTNMQTKLSQLVGPLGDYATDARKASDIQADVETDAESNARTTDATKWSATDYEENVYKFNTAYFDSKMVAGKYVMKVIISDTGSGSSLSGGTIFAYGYDCLALTATPGQNNVDVKATQCPANYLKLSSVKSTQIKHVKLK